MTAAPPYLPPPLPGPSFVLDDPLTRRVACYGANDAPSHGSDAAPLLLLHTVNAAGSAYEVRPLFEHYRASRPTYAIDLPGFGLSDRSAREYSPRLMTDAVHLVTREIRRRHGGRPIDALAVSLSCEYLARAACEEPAAFRSLALVSPSGFGSTERRMGPPGSTRFVPALYRALTVPLWDDALYGLLTRPRVIRYFLERTWGAKGIDEPLLAYDVLTTRQYGAKRAPFYFLSANLFSNDVNAIYDAVTVPVWLSHGVRGDFHSYRGLAAMRSRSHWRFSVFPTGALPYFEVPEQFHASYDTFLEDVPTLTTVKPGANGTP
jgi:pimeloyl-ACP methyl ester carboxylesterase